MLRLVQTQLICPKHGLRFMEVLKERVEIVEGITKNGWSQVDHFCQQCDPRKFFEALKNCGKIEMLDTSDEGPTNRKRQVR